MDKFEVATVENVVLSRRGYFVPGTLILLPYHLVFNFRSSPEDKSHSNPKNIWICYPVIGRIKKTRGSLWLESGHNSNKEYPKAYDEVIESESGGFDHYKASHIRIHCKDFSYYSFDFVNDLICTDVFKKMSSLITAPLAKKDVQAFYAFEYRANLLEENLEYSGWDIYDPLEEYARLGLLSPGDTFWRTTSLNEDYKFCSFYPNLLVVPTSISDSVLKHAVKFRSRQRIPSVVYKHRGSKNGNIIARCSQPLVGMKFQNRSIQDEKLVGEIFETQDKERMHTLSEDDSLHNQAQKNLIVDLRPLTNAMAQHALGAGTENIDHYRKKRVNCKENPLQNQTIVPRHVDKIFGNIDNIHVVRDSLSHLSSILNDMDLNPPNTEDKIRSSSFQQALVKTQWLHRISLILKAVDRIVKSIHLNNTNVLIHCSDGWDRTSQISALLQLCLDPFYRTYRGFMILIEKEWTSFGYKFSTRADHSGCIGALVEKPPKAESPTDNSYVVEENGKSNESETTTSRTRSVASFLQMSATNLKNKAVSSAASLSMSDIDLVDGKSCSSYVYTGSNEKSPVFLQFLDCVYQLYRQNSKKFEFNSRFLKRLFYHYHSCQYGSFLGDSEKEVAELDLPSKTISVWDYFNSRPEEFFNKDYEKTEDNVNGVLFFNFTDVKWWFEIFGRSDEEMNGLSNSLDRKFQKMNLKSPIKESN